MAQLLFTRPRTEPTRLAFQTRRDFEGQKLTMTVMDRLNASLEKWLPEQRLFLRSDDTTRFVRLRPVTQMVGISGITLVFGWTLVASSFLVIDAVSSGNTRDQIQRSQAAFEERLSQLQAERDARAAEARWFRSRTGKQQLCHLGNIREDLGSLDWRNPASVGGFPPRNLNG